MKKAIRLMAMVMAMLMALTLLVGCDSNPDTSNSGTSNSGTSNDASSSASPLDSIQEGLYDFGGITVTLAHPYEWYLEPGISSENDRLIERIAQIEKNWNVKLEFKTIDADTYWESMVTAVMGNEPYGDLMFAFPWYMPDWIAGGAVKDLSPIIEELGLDLNDGTWSKVVTDDYTIGNQTFALSRGYNEVNYGLLYNPKMFTAAGLTDPNELIAAGGSWDYDTLRDYAKQLTKVDSSTGATQQYGMASCGTLFVTANFILSNGGSFVNVDENGIPSYALNESKALTGLQYMYDMAYVDKSLTSATWDGAAQQLLNGQVGMYLCEEWVIEYVQEYAVENGLEDCYAMTYFPIGPDGTDYVDTSYGGNGWWIPSTVSDEHAKAALAVYAALYYPEYDGLTKEEIVTQRSEELFADEASAAVYVDIIMSDRAKSAGYARMGLNEIMGYFSEGLFLGDGTPQSSAEEYRVEIESLLEDSAYMQTLKKQQQ